MTNGPEVPAAATAALARQFGNAAKNEENAVKEALFDFRFDDTVKAAVERYHAAEAALKNAEEARPRYAVAAETAAAELAALRAARAAVDPFADDADEQLEAIDARGRVLSRDVEIAQRKVVAIDNALVTAKSDLESASAEAWQLRFDQLFAREAEILAAIRKDAEAFCSRWEPHVPILRELHAAACECAEAIGSHPADREVLPLSDLLTRHPRSWSEQLVANREADSAAAAREAEERAKRNRERQEHRDRQVANNAQARRDRIPPQPIGAGRTALGHLERLRSAPDVGPDPHVPTSGWAAEGARIRSEIASRRDESDPAK